MMVKATSNLPHAMILARYYAKQAVKADWRKQGLKPQYIEPYELAKAAKSYLSEHPELIEQAAETVRNHPKLRTLAEREERQRKGNRR
jgi:hypothetical protein